MAYTKTYAGPDFIQTPGDGSIVWWMSPEDVAFHRLEFKAVPEGGLEITQINTVGHIWWKAGEYYLEGTIQEPIPAVVGERIEAWWLYGAVIRQGDALHVHFKAEEKGRFAFDIVAAPLDQETWYTKAKEKIDG